MGGGLGLNLHRSIFFDLIDPTSKKKMKNTIITATFSALLTLGTASAATTFTGTAGGDINDAGNWDSGLPSNSNLGTLGTTSVWSDATLADFDFEVVGGAILTRASDFIPNFQDDTDINIINGEIDIDAGTGTRVLRMKNTSTVTVGDNGILRITANRKIEMSGTSALFVNGGTIIADHIIANAGTGAFLTFGAGNGLVDFSSSSAITSGYINFLSGSGGALDVDGADTAHFSGLWDAGQLKKDGANTGTFAQNFSVSGSVLTTVPEPSSAALLGLGGLALILRRRK